MASVRTKLFRAMDVVASKVSARSREKKHQLFLEVMRPLPTETIVDVGANSFEHSGADNYIEKHYFYPENITCLTLDDPARLMKQYPRIRVVQGDGRQLPFADNEFDIAYSNAVIEHVGSASDQKLFLSELVRVSKRGFITTPNKSFPVEPHTRVPILHFLPKRHFDRFLVWFGKPWATGSYMNLLTKRGLENLAADAGIRDYKLFPGRFWGFTMTYVLAWEKAGRTSQSKKADGLL